MYVTVSKKMKVTTENNFGTFEHVTELCLNAELKIGGNNQGQIQISCEFPSGVNTSATVKLKIIYSGHLNLNSGISKRFESPFQMTAKAQEVFSVFSKNCEQILLDYIKEN